MGTNGMTYYRRLKRDNLKKNNMKKIMITTMLVIAAISASAQRLQVGELGSSNREALATDRDTRMTKKQLFDFGWQFTHNGKTENVDLPHDWDIFEGPNSGQGATGTGGGWFEAGKGEYRKTFKSPDSEIVRMHFEGVYQKAEVFINGQKAGQHHYGYTPFTVDVTRYLYKDKKQANEVVVKVDNSQQPNCRWYSGSGIYRHVWLETMPALHIVGLVCEVDITLCIGRRSLGKAIRISDFYRVFPFCNNIV